MTVGTTGPRPTGIRPADERNASTVKPATWVGPIGSGSTYTDHQATTETTMTARHQTAGFTLIELMITVAIVGILAAVAIPAYGVFTVRARVSEGIIFATRYKAELADYITANGALPTVDNDYLVQTGNVMVTKVKWSIGRGAIEVWFGAKAGAELNGTILWLVPTLAVGSVQWICRGHSGDGGIAWRLDPRYLPSSCR